MYDTLIYKTLNGKEPFVDGWKALTDQFELELMQDSPEFGKLAILEIMSQLEKVFVN